MSQLSLILPVGSLILATAALFGIYQLRQRVDQALGGTNSEALEKSLSGYHAGLKQVDAKLDRLLKSYRELSLNASLASQKISVVRFNPFGDTGGDQSFALAVLDAHNSGYVLTSIHGREGTRVYVKPVDFGRSKYTLSNEEKQALEQAAKRVPKVSEEDSGEKG